MTDLHSVSVFTPSGQCIRRYGQPHSSFSSLCIAIDPSGYSLFSTASNTLLVFNTNGVLVHTVVEGFPYSYCVSVSPTDQSVWVADTHNDRFVKY